MKREAQTITNAKVKISVTLSNEEVGAKQSVELAKLAKTTKQAGFRKGKVPKSLIEKLYGKSVRSEIAQKMLDNAFKETLKEHKIDPVSMPTIEKISFEDDTQPIELIATVEMLPKVDLSLLPTLKLSRKISKVKDSQIDELLKQYQNQHARLEPAEGGKTVEDKDYILFDCNATDEDGKVIANLNGDAKELEVNSTHMLKEFYENIQGLKVGDSKEFKIKLPKSYPDPELADKEVLFKVKINEIKSKILPKLDDSFAKEVSKFETLKEFRSDICNQIETNNKLAEDNALRDRMIDQLLKDQELDLPEQLVEAEVNRIEANSKSKNMQSRSREDIEREVRRSIKVQSILVCYSKEKDVKLDDNDLNAELLKFSKMLGSSLEETRAELERSGAIDRIADQALTEKIYNLMLSETEVTDEIVEDSKQGEPK
ncbi:MAG: trigger factor [Nitrospinota bacterium]